MTRFAFGKNWQSFRREIDDARVDEATRSLRALVGDLAGKTFLDVGCGSGIHALAAAKLGARVVAFDADEEAVACTRVVCRDADVRLGSVLDDGFVRSLGTFDVVYAWGSLHHTGDMWRAFELASSCVAPKGILAVAIYNRVQGRFGELSSESWWKIKRAYVRGSALRKGAMLGAYLGWRTLLGLRRDTPTRGMSFVHDARDWVGGFPYEYASIDEVERFARMRGLSTRLVKPAGGWGNNEYVFDHDRLIA